MGYPITPVSWKRARMATSIPSRATPPIAAAGGNTESGAPVSTDMVCRPMELLRTTSQFLRGLISDVFLRHLFVKSGSNIVYFCPISSHISNKFLAIIIIECYIITRGGVEMLGELFAVAQAAECLKTCDKTIRRMIKVDKLAEFKIGSRM